jgi:hypothetical protein
MQLTRLMQHIEKYRIMLEGGRYLEINYEALVVQRQVESHRILDFLKIDRNDPPTIDSEEKKIGLLPDSLQDMLDNYEEIRQAFRGTDFERFLS